MKNKEQRYMYLVLKRDYYTFVMSIWNNQEDAIKEKERLFDLARSLKFACDNDWEEENKNIYLVVKREINISQDFQYDFKSNELKE